MSTIPKLEFRKWVPTAAQTEILKWWELAATPKQRAVLRRLTSDDRMLTEVWQPLQKLPAAAGREGEIMEWTILGERKAANYQSPLPSRPTLEQVRNYLQEHKRSFSPTASAARLARSLRLEMKYKRMLPTAAESAAEAARRLFDTMHEVRQKAEVFLQSSGAETAAYARALEQVAVIAQFFDLLAGAEEEKRAMDQVMDQAVGLLEFPSPRKKSAPNAPQIAFTNLLSRQFKKHFGAPCHRVVGALVHVAMNLKKDLGAATVRDRQRKRVRRRRSDTPGRSPKK
jgi:hypothetical protein